MGHVYVNALVSARRKATVRFLVDTGATYTIVSPSIARKIGAPLLSQRFAVTLADGRFRRLQACLLGIQIGGRSGPTTALLLPGDEPLLGVETLGTLGLKVNPNKRKLESSRAAGALLVAALPVAHADLLPPERS